MIIGDTEKEDKADLKIQIRKREQYTLQREREFSYLGN